MVPVPVEWPELAVETETSLSRAAQSVGLARDIELEWEEFNRSFRVRSPDRRFATTVLDARMMEWLLGLSPRYSFEIDGGSMLASTAQVHPWEIERVLATALEFRDRIPGVTSSLFGGVPPPRPDRER